MASFRFERPAAPRSPRRLQRPPDFTGPRLSRFREVWWRHGFPGLVFAVLLYFGVADGAAVVCGSMTRALGHPQPYVLGFSVLCVVLVAHARRRAGSWKPATLLWIGYLGALSLWEEWAFRVALPQWLMDQSLPSVGAVVLANALFGGMHYVTLRWRWQLCLGAALGGLLLSRNFAVQQDLLLLGALHWVGTYLNTPHPPSPR